LKLKHGDTTFNNVRYQMAARVMRCLMLLFQGFFFKYQMAIRVTRYLIEFWK